ncbi:MAG: flagellar motor switch protein FliG [Deltaproteobacteria bacterium]|nr:flagellar motor switch protein FliG [Deltaproteobacteria bacterium]
MASQLTGHEKSAILLSLVGEETAAAVLQSLDMHEVGKITTQMSRLKTIRKETLETVLKEVTSIISRDDVQFVAGDEYIKKVLSKGFGEDSATKVLERALKDAPFDSLRWVDPWALANILMTEHPQTIAFILCLLEPVRAAEVLALFNEDLRANIAMRIAVTERIPETAIEEIRDVFDNQVEMGVSAAGIKVGGMKTIAEILNHSDRSTEEALFLKLEEKDKALADAIRELMFVFDDLVDLDDRSIQMVLKEVATEELSLALKTASDGLKTKIFKNMSQRASDILKEEISSKGPVKVSDVEKAQLKVVGIARKLEAEGKIVIGRGGGEEVVV